MKKYLSLLLLSVAFLLAACGGKTEQPEPTDPDTPIEVQAGKEFQIVVTTAGQVSGLHWEVAADLDTNVVDYVWKEFVPKGSNSEGSGWDVWKFKAIAPGQTTITLGYYRGMTEDTTKTIVFTIIVK